MSLVQTTFGMCAEHTTSEPLREAFVKIAKKLTNIDRMKRPLAWLPVASFQSRVRVRAGIGDEGRRK